MQDGTGCPRENVTLSVGAAAGEWGAVLRGAPSLACLLELASKGGNAGLHVASRSQEVILLVPGPLWLRPATHPPSGTPGGHGGGPG